MLFATGCGVSEIVASESEGCNNAASVSFVLQVSLSYSEIVSSESDEAVMSRCRSLEEEVPSNEDG